MIRVYSRKISNCRRVVFDAYLAKTYSDLKSKKLYDKSDLITRFMHQWGVEYMKGGQ